MSECSFWGRYDIRAVVNESFGPEQYRHIGRAYALYLQQTLGKGPHWVSVGHDARLHSPELVKALIQGLQETGVNIVELGLSTSPIVYFSEHLNSLNVEFPPVAGTIMVTASHNPAEYNGVKFTYQKRTMEEAEFLAVRKQYIDLVSGQEGEHCNGLGEIRPYNILPEYITWFREQFGQIGLGMKIVVDSGNATAGIVAPDVLRLLGCEVVDIFTEPDGRFPNHHPDPCVHKNLTHLIDKVLETQADFGVAFDGDSDRLGVVDNQGRIMPGDQITMLLAEDVLAERPGATIAFDIKGTQTLFDYIQQRSGNPILSASGHVYMKRLMKDQDIPLGGELSGHIFFRDHHWGFDDALYAACRLITAVAHRRQKQVNFKLSDFIQALPNTRISEELRIHCSRDAGKALMKSLKITLEDNPEYFGMPVTDILTIDGLRANMSNGFFLVRASGTEPCITIRFEAPDEATYQFIEARIDELSKPLLAHL